ncbi:myo-inositol-1-phosphate synthase [Micromonospora phaseoli]|uniref:Myo-inositol-1-phosphate synthase n=1 Tax=Micromonospora phaseoli TaxID=1144548 RepID=A0A1H7DT61_9ACTN|nr:inositol-3-phosphate synthase [Micromonospora phaseoli]PZV99204.1 myo-inositol-1-phosphate synthase [Micromonospora phaseoli]GIJ80000.1 myo-inositol-1-phosphate synthase [Micromonospora phaseoli]SEK04926.1 myo-inositol-1-phosphate synthase [Micromonospora phaseoli]
MTVTHSENQQSPSPSRAPEAPVGLWLNGARGSVATTAITGLLALRAGMASSTGCVTDTGMLRDAPLASWTDLVIGGHDIVDTPLEKKAESLVDSGVIPAPVLAAVRGSLPEVERNLRTGYDVRSDTGPQAEVIDRLVGDIEEFRRRHGLARVVVINVSSTEPPAEYRPEHDDLDALTRSLADPQARALPPSSVVAYAAFQAGCGFVDFTPSTGARMPALELLAQRQQVPFAGSDGKTGETLLRTALAPMFTSRALHVLSWAGVNLLGGGDGATLEDPANAKSKLSSKAGVLPALLGEDVTAPLHIDNVPDLGDHKTAWDHVSFEGFLGVRMSMQLTWSGVDSTLAAPLVLDLARLTAAAHRAGHVGPIEQLGFFFKDPIGTDEHALADQARVLADWANGLDRQTGS